MPIHMDISPIHRLVIIVARGQVTPDEINRAVQELVEAGVPHFGKIIDVSVATSDLTKEQVERMAALLRGRPDEASRGPVAFVINPNRVGFANAFADVTKGDRPVRLFRSLHDARRWLDQNAKA